MAGLKTTTITNGFWYTATKRAQISKLERGYNYDSRGQKLMSTVMSFNGVTQHNYKSGEDQRILLQDCDDFSRQIRFSI